MQSAADIAGEMDQGLALLFQRGLELALQIQSDAMTAESPGERAKLALGFHRLSRSVRQTAALRMKLATDATRAERDDARQVVDLQKARIARRKDQLTAEVKRLIWTEAEPDEHQSLRDDLEDLLDIEELDEGFASAPIGTQVVRLCEQLGLPSPLAAGGVGLDPTDDGSHGDLREPSPPEPDSPAQPRIRPAQAVRRLPQGETDEDDDLLSDDYWRSSG